MVLEFEFSLTRSESRRKPTSYGSCMYDYNLIWAINHLQTFGIILQCFVNLGIYPAHISVWDSSERICKHADIYIIECFTCRIHSPHVGTCVRIACAWQLRRPAITRWASLEKFHIKVLPATCWVGILRRRIQPSTALLVRDASCAGTPNVVC